MLGLNAEDDVGVGVVIGVAGEGVGELDADERGFCVAQLEERPEGVGGAEINLLAEVVGAAGVLAEDATAGDAEVNAGKLATEWGDRRGLRGGRKSQEECGAGNESEAAKHVQWGDDQERAPGNTVMSVYPVVARRSGIGGDELDARRGHLLTAGAERDADEREGDADAEERGAEGDGGMDGGRRWGRAFSWLDKARKSEGKHGGGGDDGEVAEGEQELQRKQREGHSDGNKGDWAEREMGEAEEGKGGAEGAQGRGEDGAGAVELEVKEEDASEEEGEREIGVGEVVKEDGMELRAGKRVAQGEREEKRRGEDGGGGGAASAAGAEAAAPAAGTGGCGGVAHSGSDWPRAWRV